MSALIRVARSLGAAGAIVAVLVGLPMALWWLATPRFAELVHGGSVIDLLLRPDDGTLLLSGLALVAGVAWLILSVSIVGELGAALVRRPAPSIALPGFRLGGTIAAALVAALLGGSPALAASEAAAAPLAVASTADPAGPSTVQPPPGPEYIVAARDSLWRIAEDRLGDGLRWHEIFDLNAGRPQADGGRLSNDAVLTPGWVLILPADASTSVTVESGDTLRGLAAEQLGDADRADELFELNEGVRQPDGTALTTPGQIRPGWKLHLPMSDEPAATAPPTITPQVPLPPGADHPAGPSTTDAPQETSSLPTPTTARPPAPETEADTGNQARPIDAPAARSSSATVTAIGLTVALAGGVLTALALRRRRQLRHRPYGHRVAVPSDGAGRLEWAAERNRSTTAVDDRLDLALRSLVHPDLRPNPAPHLQFVERSGATARIQLAGAVSPPDALRGVGRSGSVGSRAGGIARSSGRRRRGVRQPVPHLGDARNRGRTDAARRSRAATDLPRRRRGNAGAGSDATRRRRAGDEHHRRGRRDPARRPGRRGRRPQSRPDRHRAGSHDSHR